MSPLLFLLVAEGLNRAMKAEGISIEGVYIGNKMHTISQFADDTTIILRLRRAEEIEKVDRVIQSWLRATAMRENIMQREGLPLGDQRTRNDLPD